MINGQKLDEHLKEPPPRIEFLEYLKKEFIQWWEERKERKQGEYWAEQLSKNNKKLKKELVALNGRKLAAFSGFLLQSTNGKGLVSLNDYSTMLDIYRQFQLYSDNKYGIKDTRTYGLFDNKDEKDPANP